MSKIDIHRILRNTEHWIDVSAGIVLTDLIGFLSSVESDGFSKAYQRLSGRDNDGRNNVDALAAVDGVASKLVEKLAPVSASLFGKALQEALLDTSGIHYDLQLDDVETGLQEFLSRAKRSAFIELVLVLFVFHSIWISIQDDVRRSSGDELAFLDSMAAVRTLSQSVAAEVIKESIVRQELERAGKYPDAGVRILARVESRVLQIVGA